MGFHVAENLVLFASDSNGMEVATFLLPDFTIL
jgi:hypothetical protein